MTVIGSGESQFYKFIQSALRYRKRDKSFDIVSRFGGGSKRLLVSQNMTRRWREYWKRRGTQSSNRATRSLRIDYWRQKPLVRYLLTHLENSDRISLAKTVINIITKICLLILCAEKSFFRDIHSCSRSLKEPPACSANKSRSLVSKYYIQNGQLNSSINRRFAVLMIKNNKLSCNTRSFLIFKFTIDGKSS